jgi:hypothetical protein
MWWRLLLAAVIGLLIGVVVVLGINTKRVQVDERGLKSELQQIQSELSNLKAQVAEAKASSLVGTARAKPAAVDAALDTASSIGVPAPPKQDMETKRSAQIDPETKKSEVDAVEKAAANVPDSAVADTPDCQKLMGLIRSATEKKDLQDLKGAEAVTSLKDCKGQVDKRTQDLNNQYKAEGCDQHPDAEQCKKTKEEMKQNDDLDKLLKVVLTIVAIYLIMDGDVETGLLLLTLANGIGSSSPQGASGSTGTNGSPSAQTAQSVTPSSDNASAQAVAANGFKGTGTDIACVFGDESHTSLSCTFRGNQDSKVLIDPKNAVLPANDQAGRADIQKYLADAISANNGNSLVTWCARDGGKDPHNWLSGIILQQSGNYYPITITSKQGVAAIVFSEKSHTVANDCKAF